MYTINIYIKFALIAGGFLLAILLNVFWGFWYAFPFWLLGIVMLASYIFLGTVQTSAELVQIGDFQGAQKRLGLTKWPNLLYVTNRAFYYIMKGTIATNLNDHKAGEEYFNTALNLKLPSDNEKAMVLMQLANIKATKGNWTAATNYFKQAKPLKITQPDIKNQLDLFEKTVKNNKGQMKVARSMGKHGMNMMRQPGSKGKRRRPKMR